jgi:hypothetical protein
MRNVIYLTFCLFPVCAYADSLLPSCPGREALSELVLDHSGCVDGYKFSDFWAIGEPAGSILSSTDAEFLTTNTGKPAIEFTGFTVNGGSTGAMGYEIVSYMISTLSGDAIDSLDLEVGALHQSQTGGAAWVWELALDSNYQAQAMWAFPGGSSEITLANPTPTLQVFDIVALYAPAHDTVTLDTLSLAPSPSRPPC